MISQRRVSKQGIYQIKVKEHLNVQWKDWFDGFEITMQPNEETVLTGSVEDQAALYGLLAKIRDLGLTLLSVNQVESELGQKSQD